MIIRVRTEDFRLFVPVPAFFLRGVVRILPEKLFDKLRAHTPEPYSCLITKAYAGPVLEECLRMLRENKGLEIVHVEASDGTFVSVRL